MLTQYRAIATGREKITKVIISSVAKECLKPIRPMLNALKNDNENELKHYQDIYLDNKYWDNLLQSEQNKALIHGNFQKSNKNVESNNQSLFQSKQFAIIAWLTQGGFTLSESKAVAIEVINNMGADTELNTLNSMAFQILTTNHKQFIDKPVKKPKKTIEKKASSLLLLHENAFNDKVSVYETLKKYNFIADIDEFIN